MRIFWACFDYSTSEPWIDSLSDIGDHEVILCRYNRLPWPTDRHLLEEASRAEPDLIIYTGTAGGPEIPSASTLARLRKRCPTVLLSGDLGDPPWWPYLETYRKHDCFDLVVNFDGNDDWPKQGRDYTTLAPIAPKFYAGNSDVPLVERPIPFGFCGTASHHDATDPRRKILDPLIAECGLVRKPWSPVYKTYHTVGEFLGSVRLTPNMPWSGSGQVTQVKARVLEAGQSRTCLMDHVDSQARKWFKPMIDYAVYDNAKHAVEVAHDLLKNVDLMQSMADNLHKAVLARPATEFWKRIIETAKP